MKSARIFVHGLVLLIIALAAAEAMAQARPSNSKKVYVIEITGEIDLAMTPYVRRVLDEAAEARAAAVVLHVNTLGGRVDVAADIKDALLDSPVPVIAYVDKRAISAGAFIALSAGKIAMAPGGTIGAATPVTGNGERAPEKVVSFMRSEMRSTAERNRRDPKIAEAMVDEAVTLGDSSIKKDGQLLTLTTNEAEKVGYCDAVAPTLTDALASFGYAQPDIVEASYAWSDTLIRILTFPAMSSILIMLGLGGIFFTVKTGHVTPMAAIGVVAIALFFGAQYLTDMATFVEVLMVVAGVLLILLEVFVIPGFGITGISGALLLVGGLFLSLVSSYNLLSFESLTVPLYTLAAALVGLVILVALMIRYLPHSSTFNRFVLATAEPASAGFVSAPDYHALLGHDGAAITTLRPAGVAQLGGERFDVITDGEYIRSGEPVKVVRVEGRKIVVRKVA